MTSLYIGLCISVACLSSCQPTETTTTETAEVEMPVASGCGSLAIACYDELAQQSSNIVCFRPTSRWTKTALTWILVKPLTTLSENDQNDAIDRALTLWADASSLSFTEATGADNADLKISFDEGSHGDPFPFDGAGGTLGHSFFPGTQQAGEIHLCSAESWTLSPIEDGFDLFTVILHELGHALGLEHSIEESAVMAPSYAAAGFMALTQTDVDAIRVLYGSADGSITPIANPRPGDFGKAPFNLTDLDDPDSDGDGIPDTIEVFILDTDPFVADSDEDGATDFQEVFIDGTVAAAFIEAVLTDTDSDGLIDVLEETFGTDPTKPDTDNDGLSDAAEVFFFGTNPLSIDTDGDGLPDGSDPFPTNAFFIEDPDGPLRDCNNNDRADGLEIIVGAALDCNNNLIPDECDLTNGISEDCNGNLVPDECDIDTTSSLDDNDDGVPDECSDLDCNGNGIADFQDIFDFTSEDCNNNSQPDECDIEIAFSFDNNGDGVPDECESNDCNFNGIEDATELSLGSALDCNNNSVLDDCDITDGTSIDTNGDNVPDECTFGDCNGNGIPDSDDIVSGFSNDCDSDGNPDECMVSPTIVSLATGTPLITPSGIAFDPIDGQFVVLDAAAQTVWRVDQFGLSSIKVVDSRFVNIMAIAYRKSTDTFLIADAGAATIWELTPSGSVTVFYEGTPLFAPRGIAITANDDVIVSDEGGPPLTPPPPSIFRMTNGQFNVVSQGFPLAKPSGVIEDVFTGDIIVADAVVGQIFRISASGSITGLANPPIPEAHDVIQNKLIGDFLVVGKDAVVAVPADGSTHKTIVSSSLFQKLSGIAIDGANAIIVVTDPAASTIFNLVGSLDCNGNGVPDECDINSTTSNDCDLNNVPDECELPYIDCNTNSIPDTCDIFDGTSVDIDADRIPDECQP